MKLLFSKLVKNFPFFSGMALAGVIFSSFFISQGFERLNSLGNLNDGLKTCLSRVGQSFMAGMLGEKNVYLSENFILTTEECLGDVISTSSDLLQNYEENFEGVINSLSTITYSLHKELSEGTIIGESIAGKYENIEAKGDTFLEGLALQRLALSEQVESYTFTLYLSLLVFTLIGFFGYLKRRQSIEKQSQAEADAQKLLQSEQTQDLSPAMVEYTLLNALEENNMPVCAKLFSKYHSDVLDGKLEVYFSPQNSSYHGEQRRGDADNLKNSTVNELSYNEEDYRAPQSHKAEDHEVNLDYLLGKILEVFSEETRKLGIIIETKIDDNSFLAGEPDALSQIFYLLIKDAIESSKVSVYCRKISLHSRSVGGHIVVDIKDSGNGFDDGQVKTPLNILHSHGGLPENQTICYELVTGLNGEMKLNNHYSSNAEESGGHIQISLPRSRSIKSGLSYKSNSSSQKKSKKVLKGRKKDILRSMNQ